MRSGGDRRRGGEHRDGRASTVPRAQATSLQRAAGGKVLLKVSSVEAGALRFGRTARSASLRRPPWLLAVHVLHGAAADVVSFC